jgi:hypothetical protein
LTSQFGSNLRYDSRAADALQQMLNAGAAYGLRPVSLFRAYDHQVTLFNREVNEWKALGYSQADAEAKAKEIRAEGDVEAAKSYEIFQKNPELAKFLRKLDSLREIMRGRTTIVVDTNTVPFDLLKPGAENLGTK